MCDTMVALDNATADGTVIFAKNSDRQPNEPHQIIRIPRKQYAPGERLRCTYIDIEQAEETYAVLLLKPSWMWGAEMGCNEFGVTIGNEAVFTKEPYKKTGLLGMDLVRLALERARTGDEALDVITELLETYGQGGDCGYEKPFTYHNSFLIADPASAWVLETAGEYWAAEKVKDIRAISNGLTIGSSFDRHHPQLIEHAMEKGWCRREEDFHFARCYSDPLYTRFSRAKERKQCAVAHLEAARGRISVQTMKTILRSHTPSFEEKVFARPSLKSVCMHGGGFIGDHTTGSYVVSLHRMRPTHWVTGSSTPCISMFKPLWLLDAAPYPFRDEEEDEATHYWMKREKLHRLRLENRLPQFQHYLSRLQKLESEYEQKAAAVNVPHAHPKELLDIMAGAWRKEASLVDETLQDSAAPPAKIKGNPYYRAYWKKQNRKIL